MRLRQPDGRVVTRTFPTIGEARRYEALQRAARYRGDWVDPAALRRPLRDVAEEWRGANVAKRGSTRARDRSALDRHVLPLLGDRRVGSICRQDVPGSSGGLVRGPGAPLGQVGVRRAARRAQPRLRGLRGRGAQPLHRGGAAAAAQARAATAHPDQLLALARATPPEYEPMVWVAALTRLRWGEVAGLTVGQLRLAHPCAITVDRTAER